MQPERDIWEEIYSSGKQINRFPFSHVVQFFKKYSPQTGKPVRVLELGCGVGNNLWGLAREGSLVTGLDGSASALEYARRRFAEDGLAGEFVQFYLGADPLPLQDESFDLVVDRGALCYLNYQQARGTLAEVWRVLAPSGRLLFTPFAKDSSGFQLAQTDALGLSHNIPGPLGGSAPTAFYDVDLLSQVLPYHDGATWRLLSFELVRTIDILADHEVAEYRVVAEKVAAR